MGRSNLDGFAITSPMKQASEPNGCRCDWALSVVDFFYWHVWLAMGDVRFVILVVDTSIRGETHNNKIRPKQQRH